MGFRSKAHQSARKVRLPREGETLNALLRRLDKAIGRYYDTGEPTDEINPPSD
jgi:hypothetical protein